MSRKDSPHLLLARAYWRSLLKAGDLAIDATLGNGHDACFLHELGASVVGLDIQIEALKRAKERLDGVELIHISHAEIASLPLRPKLVVFNLGYLPGGDKRITTLLDSTLKAAQGSLEILAPRGALSMTCYPGHEEGLREESALCEWASQLPQDRWEVCHHRWLNRPRSPSLLWIAALQP